MEPLAPVTARQGDILDSSTTSTRGGVDSDQSTAYISRINLQMRDIDENNDADGIIN